jgi:HTH-type transcriptional regulator/antitoxin HigA
MELKPIHTNEEYEAALAIVEPYFDQEPATGSTEADHFEIMVMRIVAYEAKHYAVLPPDPIEAIKFQMEQAELGIKYSSLDLI